MQMFMSLHLHVFLEFFLWLCFFWFLFVCLLVFSYSGMFLVHLILFCYYCYFIDIHLYPKERGRMGIHFCEWVSGQCLGGVGVRKTIIRICYILKIYSQ